LVFICTKIKKKGRKSKTWGVGNLIYLIFSANHPAHSLVLGRDDMIKAKNKAYVSVRWNPESEVAVDLMFERRRMENQLLPNKKDAREIKKKRRRNLHGI
jgi:uncharacterized protein YpiB (UPF0302 family)